MVFLICKIKKGKDGKNQREGRLEHKQVIGYGGGESIVIKRRCEKQKR